MAATITKRNGDLVTVSVTIRLDGPMLEAEETIQESLNDAGMLLEQENLTRFDSDGSPIQVGPVRLTSKGQSPQVYETPYGPVEVDRHVYQWESKPLWVYAEPRIAQCCFFRLE